MDDSNQAKVKSLYKAMQLLDYFTPEHPERGVIELAELSGLLKSSVHNIMSTLSLCGIVEKNTNTGKYHLSSKIFEYYHTLVSTDKDRPFMKRAMQELANTTGENLYMAIPSGPEIIYVDAAYPQNALFARSIIGVKAEMYCTSIGKAMLAFLDEAAVQAVVKKGFTSYTPYTITTEEGLRAELEAIRLRGYALDNMEHENGIRCIGVPVFNYANKLTAALSISGPSLRISDERIPELAGLLLENAEKLKTVIDY